MKSQTGKFDLTLEQLAEVKRLLRAYLDNTEVWVYGSRVKSTAKASSDLDLVAFALPEQAMSIFALKERFEESSLPFRVDLFVWDELPKSFQKNIEQEHQIIQSVETVTEQLQ